jgi:hypothetical protein
MFRQFLKDFTEAFKGVWVINTETDRSNALPNEVTVGAILPEGKQGPKTIEEGCAV